MGKIKDAFNQKKPLITYISGGDPNLNMTEKMIYKLQDEGVDIIEIGIPFSDPLADGPIIQAASQRALKSGVTLKILIEKLAKIKDNIKVPIILMGYYNSILNYGEKRFVDDINEAGISGIIIPDLPFDEKGELSHYLKQENINQIFLVTPNTSEDRIKKIVKSSSGFLYAVAHLGITGENNKENPLLESYLNKVRKYTKNLPIGLGFGIDNQAKAKRAARYSDGIIIGSALIKSIQSGNTEKEMLNNAGDFVKSIKEAIN